MADLDDSDLEEALEDCSSALSATNCPFTPWEKEFVESVYEQFQARSTLSDKQKDILAKIWDKV